MVQIRIRPAEPGDAPALTELALRAKASWGYSAEFMEACRAELTMTPQKMAAWRVWVAELEGRPAGMIALGLDGEAAELEAFLSSRTSRAVASARR